MMRNETISPEVIFPSKYRLDPYQITQAIDMKVSTVIIPSNIAFENAISTA